MIGSNAPRRIDWDKQPLGELPDAEIADQLNVTPQAVYRARVYRGIGPCVEQSRTGRAPRPLSEAQERRIVADARAGVSQKVLAVRFNVGVPRIAQILIRAGVIPPKPVTTAIIDLRFEVPIAPHAKGRPKTRIVWRAGTEIRKKAFPGARPFARIYTPEETERWEQAFAELALDHRPPAMIDEAVRVDIFGILPRPANLRGIDPPGFVWAPHTRQDRDNVEKSVLDALTEKRKGKCAHGGFWTRDGIACLGETALVYAELDGAPRIRIAIRSIGHIPPEHTASAMLLRCVNDGCYGMPGNDGLCEAHSELVALGELEGGRRDQAAHG